MSIHEIQQVLWVTTPLGDGQALFLIDYGPHENTIWVVSLKADGVVKHFSSNQIRVQCNCTLEMNLTKPYA